MTTMYTICGVACTLLIIIITSINIFLDIKIDKLKATLSEHELALHDKEVNNTLLSQMCKQYEDAWLEEKEKSAELQKKLDDLPSSPKFEDPTVIHVNHVYPTTLIKTCSLPEAYREDVGEDCIKDRLIDLMKPDLRKFIQLRYDETMTNPIYMTLSYQGRLQVIPYKDNNRYVRH